MLDIMCFCCPDYFLGLLLFACKMALGNVHVLKKRESISNRKLA